MIVTAKYRIIMGTICLTVGLICTVLSGFEFYNPDDALVFSTNALGCALIGLGLVKKSPIKDIDDA